MIYNLCNCGYLLKHGGHVSLCVYGRVMRTASTDVCAPHHTFKLLSRALDPGRTDFSVPEFICRGPAWDVYSSRVPVFACS